ncbi:hypothetical protein DDB_G0273267 [Dictyostelium discoideum AX4]|uniref:Uncharacterized protein n=1 Tax=Dictyostelium discoideum TaxID=44689 RepID=Q556Q9_DICDI|nr:hypothetical protein DDB_G0273891 [Dictyostelium discoideum AX4]XP_644689.1 hypothetical protein DDB_G0273267 [Dictyostelium discoideum AX4]EAL70636.1 hypothetical protein DDB_G0273891 [Dictyostelium discoideum AX4]EAL70851.1 hypothetical protein DDB_G0273267 [Dictyostelium discoideum AX4]|eukprot:XP_644562.1 hypothetical protein DDB_G0273891 [Dictyostelium discoideum AX4]
MSADQPPLRTMLIMSADQPPMQISQIMSVDPTTLITIHSV